MKKFLFSLLLFSILFTLPINTANAQTGDFKIIDGLLLEYNGSSANVTIPSTVTEIDVQAFRKNNTIQSVVIPANVKTIGELAFYSCTNLRSVEIQGAEIIDYNAFKDCENLSYVKLPSTIKEIRGGAFAGCSSLSQINLPEGLKHIGSLTFYNTAIDRLRIPVSVSEIKTSPYELPYDYNFTVTRNSFAHMWALHYGNSELEVIDVDYNIAPSSITLSQNNINMEQGDYFTLHAKIMPENATNKGARWISSNPDVVRIYDQYFGDLYAYGAGTAVIYAVASGNENVKATCTVTVTAANTCPLFEIGQLDLPSGLKEIKNSAFEGMESITDVILPDGMTTIGSRAFANCRCLNYIYIPDSVTSIDENAFLNHKNISFYCESKNTGYFYARNHGIDRYIVD